MNNRRQSILRMLEIAERINEIINEMQDRKAKLLEESK